MYVCIYVCIYVSMYVCMYVCIYLCLTVSPYILPLQHIQHHSQPPTSPHTYHIPCEPLAPPPSSILSFTVQPTPIHTPSTNPNFHLHPLLVSHCPTTYNPLPLSLGNAQGGYVC